MVAVRRTPVTPRRATTYVNPRPISAMVRRTAGGLFGAAMNTGSIPWRKAHSENGRPSRAGTSAASTPSTPARIARA